MTLLSLLLALLIERVTAKSVHWRAKYYVDIYVDKLIHKQWLDSQSDWFNLALVIALPSMFFLWLSNWLGSGFLGLIANALILFVCLGSPKFRATYKCYLQAANRGDYQACELHSRDLGHDSSGSSTCESFGQHLVWLNYTHYTAIILGFIFFGAAGAVLYVLSYGVVNRIRTDYQDTENRALINANYLIWFLDFIPVRLTALGFLLVGHFGRALPVWLNCLFDMSVSAKILLCRVSSAAEDIEADDGEDFISRENTDSGDHYVSEAQILVKLAKRNIVLIMAVVSLLTMMSVVA